MISERTKAALAAAKARGVKLGSPKLALATKLGNEGNRASADRFARNVAPFIREVKASGITSLRATAGGNLRRSIVLSPAEKQRAYRKRQRVKIGELTKH
jgi:DNA invertase Pin-like site-specific DNA recombinase